jgi:alpha-beta hydrolase superfamily lysophospholipase
MPPDLAPRSRRFRLPRRLLSLLLVVLVALNVIAALQAHAATHFVPGAPSFEQQLAVPLPQKAWTLLTGVHIPRPLNHTTPANHNLPYEVRQIALGSQEHLEAWYVPHPSPRGIVIMFAGYAGVKEGLLTPAAHLYRFGYSSLLVDFRGSGGSSGDDTTLGIREAEDVVAAFSYASAQWPGQALLGYGVSMGSAALMRAVALYELKPRALILEGPFDRLLTTIRHRFDTLGVLSFPAAELLLLWGSIESGTNGFTHNPVEYAQHIACPTLILHGERDPWITAEEMQAVAHAIPGAARLLTVPNLGHEMPFVYGAPDLWVATVQQFLDRQSGT